MHSEQDPRILSGRRVFAAGLAGAAVSAALPSVGAGAAAGSQGEGQAKGSQQRMPVVFVPHGGGPWPFVDTRIGTPAELALLAGYLRSLPEVPRGATKAILCVSAHWEEPEPSVMSGDKPPMLYDYYGFPAESYEIQWPAPGQPALAARVRELLAQAGIASREDRERGFDHGAFVPLKVAYPDANVPTLQLSLKRGLDPREHLAIGRALAPLRDEGVFIVGSGMSYHNLRAFGPAARPVAERFDTWLRRAVALPAAERDAALSDWARAPAARQAHPREEHLLPLMVIGGAAGADRGVTTYNGSVLDLPLSAFQFG